MQKADQPEDSEVIEEVTSVTYVSSEVSEKIASTSNFYYVQTTPTHAANFAIINMTNFEAPDKKTVLSTDPKTSTDPTYIASATTAVVDLPSTDDANVVSFISAKAEPLQSTSCNDLTDIGL